MNNPLQFLSSKFHVNANTTGQKKNPDYLILFLLNSSGIYLSQALLESLFEEYGYNDTTIMEVNGGFKITVNRGEWMQPNSDILPTQNTVIQQIQKLLKQENINVQVTTQTPVISTTKSLRSEAIGSYWSRDEGITLRLQMLSSAIEVGTYNNAVQVSASLFGVLYFIMDGPPPKCSYCIQYFNHVYKSGQFMPEFPAHPLCPHIFDVYLP